MMARISSLERPGFTSACTPRSSKMRTAAGDSLSAMRTRGAMGRIPCVETRRCGFRARRGEGVETRSGRGLQGGEGFAERPVEPGGQGLQVGAVDRGPAPDAQPRRSVAVGADVI